MSALNNLFSFNSECFQTLLFLFFFCCFFSQKKIHQSQATARVSDDLFLYFMWWIIIAVDMKALSVKCKSRVLINLCKDSIHHIIWDGGLSVVLALSNMFLRFDSKYSPKCCSPWQIDTLVSLGAGVAGTEYSLRPLVHSAKSRQGDVEANAFENLGICSNVKFTPTLRSAEV